MMASGNIIVFPTRNPPQLDAREEQIFEELDRVEYYCESIDRKIVGTILQIQMDPLSGRQWRVLVCTGFVNAWRNVSEVTPC